MSDTSPTADGAATLERQVRLRALFWEYRHLLVIGCLVLLGAGAWVGYGVYLAPAETTEQRSVSEWTATGAFTHEATVTEANALYDDGIVLEEEPIYYTAISPTVDGTYVAWYDAETGEDVDITLTATVQYGAIDPDDEVVFWSEREVLESERASDVEPGEEVTMSFDLDVSAIEDRIEEIERDLEAAPGQADVYVELEREISGTIDGEPEAVSDPAVVTVDLEGNTYRFDDDVAFDERHGQQETVTVPVSSGPVRSVGGPLAVLLGLSGLVSVAVVSRRTEPPTAAEREWLAYRHQLETVDDLVVDARLPRADPESTRATVSDLESLANVGMDVGSALVYDAESGQYVVEDGDRRYVFEPPVLETVDGGTGARDDGFGWFRDDEGDAASTEDRHERDEHAGDESVGDETETGDRAVTYTESQLATAGAASSRSVDAATPTDVSAGDDTASRSGDECPGDVDRRLDPELACLAGVGARSRPPETDQNRSSEN